jgi:hypothetical protein
MVTVPNIQIDLDDLNHSELVTLASWCGLRANRGMPREVLYEHLQSFKPFKPEDPFDGARGAISSWLNRHWDRFRLQVAKKVCPNCEQCRDLQVLDCYMKNHKHL